MNLYLLKLTPLGESHSDYDCAQGFLVRAASSEAARGIVATVKERRRLGPGGWEDGPGDEGARTWLEPALSTCEEIAEGVEGASGVLLRDFNAG